MLDSQMNWDALGAVAEALGSIGVIVTLFYLISQIRQNTSSLEASSLHALMNEAQQIADWAKDRKLAEVILKGLENPAQLDDVDRFRFSAYVSSTLAFWIDAFYQFRSGHFPEQQWRAQERDIVSVQSNPGFRQVWLAQRSGCPVDFQDHVEHLIASQQAGDMPNYFGTKSRLE
jgi:hypothetical protein